MEETGKLTASLALEINAVEEVIGNEVIANLNLSCNGMGPVGEEANFTDDSKL